MNQQNYKILIVKGDSKNCLDSRPPYWFILIVYLVHIQSMRTQASTVFGILRLLIIIVALVCIALLLSSAGAPDQVPELLQYWPILP